MADSEKSFGIRSTQELSLLLDLSRAFNELLELDELLRRINSRTREVLDAENCAVLLLDEKSGELFCPANSDVSEALERRFETIRFPADRGIAGWVVRHAKSTIVGDAAADERFYPDVDRASGATTRTLLYAPLSTRHGVLGVIGLRNKRSGAFSESDREFLDALAAIISVAIDNARFHADLKISEQKLRTEVGALRRDLARRDRFTEIVGTGPAMAELFRLMEGAASSPISVLIEGETGTGKELVARAIHHASERAGGPLLAINCAALPEPLLESELFGHRRGAFTGATEDKRGLFEAANGGTLFLDEVGEMSLAMQAKLLRVLQEGEVIPVGGVATRKVDARVISATNRDVLAEVAAQRFREDLYHRLATFPIRLPSLRERREDIPLLAERALAKACARSRKRIPAITSEAIECLLRFQWPGNVRELENEISRAVALAREDEPIAATHLSPKLAAARSARSADEIAIATASTAAGASSVMRQGRAAFEARYIDEVLRQHEGNVSSAARALGMSRVTLHKKLKDYGLRR